MSSQSKSTNRVEGIDVLRGFCILAVVLHHIGLRIAFQYLPWRPAHASPLLKVLIWSGYYGVRVFFVISGFLIATWSLKRWQALQNVSLRRFYLMRFARIVPCLIALLFLLSALHLAHVDGFTINPQRSTLPRALLAALTFHINWLEGHRGYLPGGWDVLWSLSVEEVFYFFFPLLCLWTRRQWILIGILAGFVVAGPFARVLITTDPWSDYSYFSCMDGIALGCLAAILSARIKLSLRTALAWQAAGTVLVLLIEIFRSAAADLRLDQAGLDITVLNLGVALLVIGTQQRFENGVNPERLWSAPLRWLGRNSYEVYLTHMLIVWPAMRLFSSTHQSISISPVWFVGITAMTGLAGYVVARFYSEPLNRRLRLMDSVFMKQAVAKSHAVVP